MTAGAIYTVMAEWHGHSRTVTYIASLITTDECIMPVYRVQIILLRII